MLCKQLQGMLTSQTVMHLHCFACCTMHCTLWGQRDELQGLEVLEWVGGRGDGRGWRGIRVGARGSGGLTNREWAALKGGIGRVGTFKSLKGEMGAEGEHFLLTHVPLCLSEPFGNSVTCDMIESFQNSSLHVFQVRGRQCFQQIISACTHMHICQQTDAG